jgi:hypothetical protein
MQTLINTVYTLNKTSEIKIKNITYKESKQLPCQDSVLKGDTTFTKNVKNLHTILVRHLQQWPTWLKDYVLMHCSC